MSPVPEQSRLLRPSARQALIARIAVRLQHLHHPRLALLGILTVAGLSGFLSSFALLSAGVSSMPARYGLASLIGYLCFLCCVRLWVGQYHEAQGGGLDLVDLGPHSLGPTGDGFTFGGGGGFSGGGAGRSFDASPTSTDALPDVPGLDLVDGIADLDEGALVLLPVVLAGVLIVGLISAVAVLIGAPALLAEVFLDAIIAGAAYRRLRLVPSQHWTRGAFRRTWKPMLAIVVMLIFAAAIAQHLVPSADSIGDFFRRAA